MIFRKEKKIDLKKWLMKISAVFLILKAVGSLVIFFFPKLISRLKNFKSDEQKEVRNLIAGRQNFPKFLKESGKIFQDLFIPNIGNDHQPKALRARSLIVYVLIIIFIKVFVTGALFLTYPTPAEMTAVIASKMFELTNESRAAAGLGPLRLDETLTKTAQQKGEDMIARGYFAHDTPEGKKPWQWIARADYDYVYAGENLAMDFTSAEAIENAFMQSPGHKKNILNSKYQDVGIAVISGEMNGSPTDLLVVFFGTRRQNLVAAEPTAGAPKTAKNPAAEIKNLEPTVMGEALTEQSENIIVVGQTAPEKQNFVSLAVEYSNIIFIAFLIFVTLSLIVNIFVKIRIQHAPLILQSIVVIALISSMILVKFHFIEHIAPQVMIIG